MAFDVALAVFCASLVDPATGLADTAGLRGSKSSSPGIRRFRAAILAGSDYMPRLRNVKDNWLPWRRYWHILGPLPPEVVSAGRLHGRVFGAYWKDHMPTWMRRCGSNFWTITIRPGRCVRRNDRLRFDLYHGHWRPVLALGSFANRLGYRLVVSMQ
jgi:hypothetical protein